MHPANLTKRQGSAAIVPFHAAREHVPPGGFKPRVDTSEPSFCFGPFQLFPRQRMLLKHGNAIQIGCKSLDILIVLAERQGRLVTKSELLAHVWPGVTVEEGALRVQMTALRKALGDGAGEACHVKTVAGRGYCLVATVASRQAAAERCGIELRADGTPRLPLQLDQMIGRADDVRKISALLEQKRFVTVLGAGGVGKTTAAVSVGHAMLPSFAGAVHFLDLGQITEPADLPGALAALLGLSAASGEVTQDLLGHLRDQRMLLIFDNCEHLIEPAAVLMERIFHAAAQVHILATSREMLRVDGEHAYRLSGLACPSREDAQSADRVLSFAAARLFANRVAASGFQFELTDADASAVVRICHKLDGIALAINVAAARAQTLGVSAVAGSLQDRCWLFWRGQRTALPRHQTIAATIDWSYGLLSETEQAVLRHLAVFERSFTLDAARAVLAHGLPEAADNLLIIDKLVAKSLLSFDVGGGAHYRLLNSVRAYALEKLQHRGEFDAIAARARDYASRQAALAAS
jgi:predicted ATPase/DNA-binding winged helix-turn-helix (wHTH) protein